MEKKEIKTLSLPPSQEYQDVFQTCLGKVFERFDVPPWSILEKPLRIDPGGSGKKEKWVWKLKKVTCFLPLCSVAVILWEVSELNNTVSLEALPQVFACFLL